MRALVRVVDLAFFSDDRSTHAAVRVHSREEAREVVQAARIDLESSAQRSSTKRYGSAIVR